MCINYLELQATQIMENIVYIIIKIRCNFVTSSTWFKTISLVFGPSTHREYREQKCSRLLCSYLCGTSWILIIIHLQVENCTLTHVEPFKGRTLLLKH